MATDHPQRITVKEAVKITRERVSRVLVSTAATRIGQIVCGWRGHDSVLQFDRSRVFLECMSCGHQSPGWQIERALPLARVIPARQAPGRMAIVRKVA